MGMGLLEFVSCSIANTAQRNMKKSITSMVSAFRTKYSVENVLKAM